MYERNLISSGIYVTPKDIGFLPLPPSPGPSSSYADDREANVLMEMARLIGDRNKSDLSSFESCLKQPEIKQLNSHPKHRRFDGFGNNLKNPQWGSAKIPFRRFAEKNYDDGVSVMRKSVNGSELPNPRFLVQNVLLKAEKGLKPSEMPNTMNVLLMGHLLGVTTLTSSNEAHDPSKRIRCCSSGNKNVLPTSLLHSACIPIAIGTKDEFYSKGKVECLNLVGRHRSTTHYGEILNEANSFLDHSPIYGNNDEESRRFRNFTNGKLRMEGKQVIARDLNGKVLDNRFLISSSGTIWSAIFFKNHNNLADGLFKVNPSWNDEMLYQEARRINIAILQSVFFNSKLTEKMFGKNVKEEYDESVDPSSSIEYLTGLMMSHFYFESDMLVVDKENNEKRIPITDSFGRLDWLENAFDDFVRGALRQPMNFVQYPETVS
jgi:peroxidase